MTASNEVNRGRRDIDVVAIPTAAPPLDVLDLVYGRAAAVPSPAAPTTTPDRQAALAGSSLER